MRPVDTGPQNRCARAFFRYLKNKAHVLEVKSGRELESPKQLKRLPRHLSLDESQQLLETVAEQDNNLTRSRLSAS